MNKKLSLVVLGIALVGVLVYVLLSATQSEKSPAISDKTASPVSSGRSASVEPPRPEHPSPPETVNPASDNTATGPVAAPAQKQAPSLEPEIREALGKILNTSSEGLVEETRNGVTSVDLQGRFQSAPVATIDKDGNIQITDYSQPPKAPAKP